MNVQNTHLLQPLDARLREHDVIPLKKAMHGWTSQPWRPTASFIVQGARRDMNIPAKAGIQFEGWRSSWRTRDLSYKQW